MSYEQFKAKIWECAEDLAERMDRKQVGGLNMTLCVKSTRFEIRSVALALKSYIWLKEDLGKFCIQLLDQTWPLEPIRLLGIRMSSLRTIADIKKDKSLTDFFSVKLSKEQKGAEI